MQLWEHFWNIICTRCPKKWHFVATVLQQRLFFGDILYLHKLIMNISWHSHVSSLSFLYIQFSVDQIFPWILQCGCCCWPSIGEQINIGLESFSWEMMSMQHNQGTLNGRREVNTINLLTDNHLCLPACVLTQSINWKTSIFAMIKPIKSRDKDACDISSQGGMCCCCDGLKCSNVDVVLVSTIWDLWSVRIFDIAPNYACLASLAGTQRIKAGNGTLSKYFQYLRA